MQKLKKIVADEIEKITLGAVKSDEIVSSLAYPPDDSMGDLALPCFKFAKVMRKSPVMIADSLAKEINLDCIEKVEAVNGYLNFFISKKYWIGSLIPEILSKGDEFGKNEEGKGKRAVFDYSSPNLCKPFHVGHLRSTIIGHSLKKIYEFCGWDCVGINHLGDWGTQFGKQIAAYRMWGNREDVERDGVDALTKLYVRYNNEAAENPALVDLAREESHKLEMGDPENTELWKWFVSVSLAECEKTYKQLGVTFDSYAGEAFYTDKMDAEVQKMRDADILKLDDGATIVDLSEYKMPPCLILRSDGSTLYPTRDIAAAVYRKNTYNFDKCLYVTAYQQCLHFAQWFKVIELMGYDFADGLVHVPYGMVSCGGAKLATRTGNVVLIKDLTTAAVAKVKEVMKEKNPDLADLDETAQAVGVGAIVFYFLLGGRIKDIDFNMDDALSFEGNTGPYAQYSYARCCSILEKLGDYAENTAEMELTEKDEEVLSRTLAKFSESVSLAASENEPSVVTRYILDLCADFNRFYHSCPILSVSDEKIKAARVALVKATKTVLGSALQLICMKTPSKI